MNKNENAIYQSFDKLSKKIANLPNRPGLICPIYIEGGSSLFLRGIKDTYKDIDWYIPEHWLKKNQINLVKNSDEDIRVTNLSYEKSYTDNEGFRFNPTHNPNLCKSLEIDGVTFELYCMSAAMVYLIKLETGREKDMSDLELISPHITPDEIVDALNSCIRINNKEIMANMASQTLSEISIHYLLDSSNYESDIAKLINKLEFDDDTKYELGMSFGINISRAYSPQKDAWRSTQKSPRPKSSSELTM